VSTFDTQQLVDLIGGLTLLAIGLSLVWELTQ
jgi:hypothetical protein